MIGLFLVLRHFLVPESYGDLGHYRANSLQDNEKFEIIHAGKESCNDCHEDMAELKAMDLHSGLSCETCHGPGLAHMNNTDSVDMILPDGRAFCGLCHEKNAARRTDAVIQVELKVHNPDKNCTYCHNPHAPWELRNQDLPEENF